MYKGIVMKPVLRLVLALLCLSFAHSALATCDPDGVQASGSIYRICMPDAFYNGRLVIWAHGFQDAGTPVSIPEDQLCFADVCLPDLLTSLGFAFATNSYSKTGLAVRQGMDDIRDLVDIFTAQKGAPEKVYLTGASEGGIITALLAEQYPDVFAAGVAACGPIGSFRYQIDYFGDARVTFEAFWPGLIPGDPLHPTQDLIDMWSDYYENVVKPAVFAEPAKLAQWAAVARLPFDPDDYDNTIEQSVRDVLRYSVVNLNDAVSTIGAFPFGNIHRVYSGSFNDELLNQIVTRVPPERAALLEMRLQYNTSGALLIPLVTLHTSRDQQVPFKHEKMYLKRVSQAGARAQHELFAYDRYGHCAFTSDEALGAFFEMLTLAGDVGQAQAVQEYRARHDAR
jgi:pimeloyl-ACP methyl ester carboxylesterase